MTQEEKNINLMKACNMTEKEIQEYCGIDSENWSVLKIFPNTNEGVKKYIKWINTTGSNKTSIPSAGSVSPEIALAALRKKFDS